MHHRKDEEIVLRTGLYRVRKVRHVDKGNYIQLDVSIVPKNSNMC